MRWRAHALAAAVLLAAPSAAAQDAPAPGAPAQETSDAYRALIRDAVAEYAAGRYQEALALFERAQAMSPSARVLRGIAKSQFELRRYARALATIDQALARPAEELPAELRDELQLLRERTQRFVGTLTVTVTPAAAEVQVDGAPMAPDARGAFALDVGHHEVQIAALGYETARRSIDVRGGEATRLEVALVARTSAGSTTVVISPSPPERSRAPLYVGTAIGIVALGGVAAAVGWYADRDAAVDRCTSAAHAGGRCDATGAITRERDAAAWAIAGSAAVAVGAGIAVVLWATRSDDARVACGARGGLGCAAAFRF